MPARSGSGCSVPYPQAPGNLQSPSHPLTSLLLSYALLIVPVLCYRIRPRSMQYTLQCKRTPSGISNSGDDLTRLRRSVGVFESLDQDGSRRARVHRHSQTLQTDVRLPVRPTPERIVPLIMISTSRATSVMKDDELKVRTISYVWGRHL